MIEPNPFETLRQIAGGYCLSRGLARRRRPRRRRQAGRDPSNGRRASRGGRRPPRSARPRLATSFCARRVRSPATASSATRRRRGCCATDHPQSMRDYVRMFGLPPFWATFGEMEQSVRTGLPAGDKVIPGGLWAYFARAPGSERHLQRDDGGQGARPNRRRSCRLRLLGVQADWRHRRRARPPVERRARARAGRKGRAVRSAARDRGSRPARRRRG